VGDFGIAVADRLRYKGDDAIKFENGNDDNDYMQVYEDDDGDKDEDSREFARKCAGHAMDKILLLTSVQPQHAHSVPAKKGSRHPGLFGKETDQ